MSGAPAEVDPRLTRLRSVIRAYGPTITAFSGGIDSTLVAVVSAQVHGERALAVTGVLLGGAGDSPWLLAAVLACAVAKGWLIGERFMELAHAPALWRRLLLAWPLLMALAVGAALYLARMNN